MEDYIITVSHDKVVHRFKISEYPHHDGERCKYKVFEHGAFVASFEHDSQQFLHVCQNTGGIDKELLYELADLIETHIPHAESKHLNDTKS
jgi:hypothetical protein